MLCQIIYFKSNQHILFSTPFPGSKGGTFLARMFEAKESSHQSVGDSGHSGTPGAMGRMAVAFGWKE